MPRADYDDLNRKKRAEQHGTERSEYPDSALVMRWYQARNKFRGRSRTQCIRCGGYYLDDERDQHINCRILPPPPPPQKRKTSRPKPQCATYRPQKLKPKPKPQKRQSKAERKLAKRQQQQKDISSWARTKFRLHDFAFWSVSVLVVEVQPEAHLSHGEASSMATQIATIYAQNMGIRYVLCHVVHNATFYAKGRYWRSPDEPGNA